MLKKLLLSSINQKVPLFFTVFTLLYFAVRCVALDRLYMVHDERDIVFSAWSLTRSGRDLFGHTFPLSFGGISPDNPLISIWFSAVFWILIPIKNVFNARLPFVFVSSFIPYLLYLLVHKVTNDTRFSILVSLVAGISPWIFHVGRIAMDVTLAFPTMLLAIVLLLSRRRSIAYGLLALSFYNYQGFRTIILFIPFIIEWYLQTSAQKSELKGYAVHLMFVVLLILSVFLIDAKVTSRRSDQLLFLNMEKFSENVDLKRRETIFPLTISKVFDSKLTESVRYGLDTLTQGLSTQTFFFKGDASPINGTGVGGLLFISTLPFFLFGLISLREKDLPYRFLASFVVWGMIPSLASLNGHSYAIRGVLMIIGFSTLISLGLLESWLILRKHHILRKLFLIVMVALFTIDISTFTYEYFGRRPITLSEVFNERERAVSEYIDTLPKGTPVVVYDTDISTKNTFMTYAFLRVDDPAQIQRPMRNTTFTYQIRNVTFKLCESRVNHPPDAITIVSNHCLNDAEYTKLRDMKLKEIVYRDTPILVAYFVIPVGETNN